MPRPRSLAQARCASLPGGQRRRRRRGGRGRRWHTQLYDREECFVFFRLCRRCPFTLRVTAHGGPPDQPPACATRSGRPAAARSRLRGRRAAGCGSEGGGCGMCANGRGAKKTWRGGGEKKKLLCSTVLLSLSLSLSLSLTAAVVALQPLETAVERISGGVLSAFFLGTRGAGGLGVLLHTRPSRLCLSAVSLSTPAPTSPLLLPPQPPPSRRRSPSPLHSAALRSTLREKKERERRRHLGDLNGPGAAPPCPASVHACTAARCPTTRYAGPRACSPTRARFRSPLPAGPRSPGRRRRRRAARSTAAAAAAALCAAVPALFDVIFCLCYRNVVGRTLRVRLSRRYRLRRPWPLLRHCRS